MMSILPASAWRLLALAVVVLFAIFVVGCYPSHPQSTFDAQGPVADKQLTLFYWIFGAMAFVFVTVLGALLYIVIRFRRRPGQEEIPTQVHGNTRLEVVWSISPAIVLAIVAFPTVTTLFDLDRTPEGALEIKVTGHQWWWEFEYPEEGIVTANELHIPVDRAVSFTLTSADVIHAFWVPKLGGKQDVVPTRENPMWLLAEEEGEYYGQCAEFCGVSHANMRLRVIAESDTDFNAWVKQQQAVPAPPTGKAAEGAELFANQAFTGGQQCAFCHTVEGVPIQGKVGPNLTHVGSRTTIAAGFLDNTTDDLASWLRDPPGVKPGAKMPNLGLSEDQIDKLVAYLQSLQ